LTSGILFFIGDVVLPQSGVLEDSMKIDIHAHYVPKESPGVVEKNESPCDLSLGRDEKDLRRKTCSL
jgi:hypothetical protein